MRFWRGLGLVVFVFGGVILGAAAGADLAGEQGAMFGAFLGLSIGYGIFSSATGVV